MKDSEREALLARIKEATLNLTEHCDAIQVLASVVGEDGITTIISHGLGNHYARQGMAREFVERDQARTYWDERPSDPPDETESWKEK